MSLQQEYAARQRLVDALERDLVGPGADDETLDDAPATRYAAGILYPEDAGFVAPEEDLDAETTDDYDEASLPDPPVATANIRYPSSMGLTFAVNGHHSGVIRVSIAAARYVPEESSDDEAQEAANDGPRRRGRARGRWHRAPVDVDDVDLALSPPRDERLDVADGLQLFARLRAADEHGVAAVTVVLMNKNVAPASGPRDAACFFQASLSVTAPGASAPAFVDREGFMPPASDEDLRSYGLLYQHLANISTGHGCSVDWDEVDGHAASTVSTRWVPTYELRVAESNPEIRPISMDLLADGDRTAALAALTNLTDGYAAWIAERRSDAGGLDAALAEIATEHLDRCDEAVRRMRAALGLLSTNASVWTAFSLANQAMRMQRARTNWLRAGGQGSGPDLSGHEWRPFQIAFFLLCLVGIVDETSEDRQLADLLWFPTGGGKTEAYLGLIAFTIFLRRLRDAATGAGVTALMRYTLRLLTIQQFDRAALLICCCEHLRRSGSRLGTAPIEIGLWVGRGGTPNDLREARTSLDKLRHGGRVDEANPVQVHQCPWCGTALTAGNYYIAKADPRLVISCGSDDCEFSKELPVRLVDEDVYARRPALIVATADKFAGLPWTHKVAALFNRAGAAARPPDLIVQDELHLISGPLGTLAGLYETAVDALCSAGGVRPKVIASTATIRRARGQTTGLFDRDVRQFPPPGLDARDSYFAVEAPPTSKPSRLYVGLLAPSVSHATLMIRTYARLLQSAQESEDSAEVVDPYWTLVGYFNSLRVLGGARMQVQDDVSDRIELLAAESGRPPRTLDERIELTSREPSADIPDHLRRMAVSVPSPEVLDVILATNMISVGVDIDRLGLMVVMGQPQSTSEFIQATSRVGRQHPGLVITLYNAARSRDRSHYESFRSYHAALYRQVESTSVTPFSPRARDRALHAVFIALARLLIPQLTPNDGVRLVAQAAPELGRVKQLILDRIAKIAPGEVDAASAQLDDIERQWLQRVADDPNVVFQNRFHPDQALLIDPGQEDTALDHSMVTVRSLRDVDMASNLYQVR